ncbi:DapH/DapD/GlmU-related protein [Morganella morganii]|uniref:acyltransferase n=1 Tax=Morganella morganii TaxID=582 RepID=UPI0032DB3B2E
MKQLIYKIIFALFYKKKSIIFGKRLICKSIPDFIILGNGTIEIGDNVFIGRNVELRAYNDAKLIIESNCKIDNGVRIIAAKNATVLVRTGSKIGFYSVINGGGNVTIGPNSSTYGFVYIQSSAHVINKDIGFSKSDYTHEEINIGESVLIGPHSVLNPGTIVENNTVLAAHSILNKKDD